MRGEENVVICSCCEEPVESLLDLSKRTGECYECTKAAEQEYYESEGFKGDMFVEYVDQALEAEFGYRKA